MSVDDGHVTSTEQPSDEELMVAFQKGDDLAFDALYRRYRTPLLVALTRRTGGNRDIAEDLYDDAFCRVVEAKHTFDPNKGCFRPWLYQIAFNNHRGLFRSSEIFLRAVAVGLSEKLPAPLVESISVRTLLNDLPVRQRRVMELIVSGEFTLAQVAEIMGISVERVYRLRHDAVKRLRKQHLVQPVRSGLSVQPSKTD
jgi:RNA polymerase sigma-70 factor, ECF subfamily